MSFDSFSTPDPHPDWHDLLTGYALGNLSSEEAATLEALLAQRPELKADLLAYQETLAMVPYALEPQPLPPGLEQTLITAATQSPQASPKTSTLRPLGSPRPLRKPWYGAAMTAAALVIALIGTDNYQLRQQQLTLQADMERTQAEIETLQETLLAKETLLAEVAAKPQFEEVVDILRQPNALVYSLQGTGEALT